jgi:hypothetical protein
VVLRTCGRPWCRKWARLDGADLSGTTLVYVDLLGATFQDACLEKASFRFSSARGASFASAHCRHVYGEHVDLTHANFSHVDLRQATLHQCTLQHTLLNDADLTDSVLNQCNCDDSSFRGALLEGAMAVGSTFARADLDQARRFSTCREMIVEVLRREIGDDVERAKFVGAVAIGRQWCYEEWANMLAFQPQFRALALEIFRRYPESGFVEALRAGKVAGQP